MTSEDNPFSAFESDRTVIKPTAGRRAKAAVDVGGQPTGTAGAAPTAGATPTAMPEIPPGASLNALVECAAPLLMAAPRIRHMSSHRDPEALRNALAEGIRQFEDSARRKGLPNEQVVAGRYLLCTLLDEFASSTPWGGSGVWSARSLLVQFHNEAWGGEKVFQLLGRLAENVEANRSLLELIYAMLALGFEGRYRVLDNGRGQLEAVRERLADMLRGGRPSVDPELSPHWEGLPAQQTSLAGGIPVWVVASTAAVALLLVFVGLRLSIHSISDPVFAALQSLDVKPGKAPPPVAPPAPAPPRLATFLKSDIDAGLVEVRDLSDRSVVIIRGDGLFGAGSADVADPVRPLIDRIGRALGEVPGSVLVTGHTDNQPIRSLRFPSNWQLSQERAEAVRRMLGSSVDVKRLRAEGRADGEPRDDNATPAGRSRNRRVEITLFTANG